ncbi:MAG: hypothetical protein QOG91_239 [Candidatus Parcubacteria bacterium]|jgi:hypothetical protein|nr:hypothetical protein [Candidatus Parcubacteria bacterium]
MIKMTDILRFFALGAASSLAAAAVYGQTLANRGLWYVFPCSLPDVTVPEFGTARDNLLAGLAFGAGLDTKSRLGSPTAIEIRDAFDSTDLAVSTNFLWRGQFDPQPPYATQHGQRLYFPVVLVGENGQVSLERLRYRITSGLALLGNESALSGLPYSVSRRGLMAGADGHLFTADDIVIMSGPGSQLVDAIIFIGGRAGALVSQQSDFGPLDAEIGSGTTVTATYEWSSTTNVLNASFTVALFPASRIPTSYTRMVPFRGPAGVLFSAVGPPGMTPFRIESSRRPAGAWQFVTDSAVEGTSVFMPFIGRQTNDMGYIRVPQF